MPALTTVVTHATGDVLPANDWNTGLRDNINFLAVAGADLASAATITPTNEFHGVTGVTTIQNLTPAGPVAGQRHRLWIKGGPLTIQNNGGGTGNIRTLTGIDRACVPNEIVEFAYDAVNAVWREAVPQTGAMKQLFDSTLGASAASFDIQNISQAYNHLLIIAYLRGDTAAVSSSSSLALNNDAAAHYDYIFQAWDFNGTTASAVSSQANQTSLPFAGTAPGANAPANVFSEHIIYIPHYAGSANQKVLNFANGLRYGAQASRKVDGFTAWESNAAITRLTHTPNPGNWVAGSRYTVYGLL